MSDAIHEQIKAALINLSDGMKRADSRGMVAAMEQLDQLCAQHGASIDPRLAHFLERRSYAKALEYLGGASVAAGSCGPKKT